MRYMQTFSLANLGDWLVKIEDTRDSYSMLVNPDFNASQPRVLHGNLGLVHFTILVLGVYQISYYS